MNKIIIIILFFLEVQLLYTQEVSNLDVFLKGTITNDSTNIYVKIYNNNNYKFSIPKNYYIKNVHYDRMTEFISFNKCRTIDKKTESWEYELLVWDYKSNKSWIVTSGRTFSGEGLAEPIMYNFNPNRKSGLIISKGWENDKVYFYNDDYSRRMISEFKNGNRLDNIKLLVMFSQDSIIALMWKFGEENYYFNICKITNDFIKEISYDDVKKNKEYILKQMGIDITLFINPISKDINFWNTDWNSLGDFCLYDAYHREEKERVYYLYNRKTSVSIRVNKMIPIWK